MSIKNDIFRLLLISKFASHPTADSMKKQLFSHCSKTLLIALSLLTANCNKAKIQSADASTISNQLVCKIDGVEWKSTQALYSGFFDYGPTFSRRYLYLHYVSGRQEINIFINPPYNQASFMADKNTIPYPATTYPANYLSLEKYNDDMTPENICITGKGSSGRIDFTVIDSTKHIVKGKFSFKGKDERTGKMVSVTDGYFDFHQ